jgi:hypothetical protein
MMKRVAVADSEHAELPQLPRPEGLGICAPEKTGTQSGILMWLDDFGQSVGL